MSTSPRSPARRDRPPSAGPGGRLLLELPAEPSCLRPVRRRTREWLIGAGWPEDDADDVVYAVSEAASNAVEHAYPPGSPRPDRGPELRITGTVLGDATSGWCAEVRVRDRGRWRRPSSEPGHRGRGLAVMRAALGSVTVRSDDTGTEVVLVSTPVARLRTQRAPERPRRGPAPLATAVVEVAVLAASARTAAWRAAHQEIHRRVRRALDRAAEVQRRSAASRRLAEELVAALQERRAAVPAPSVRGRAPRPTA